jgi:CheY-like chemotaxis protein
MKNLRPLLIVEDSDEDFEVTCWALQQVGLTRPIIRCARAEEALLRLCPVAREPDWAARLPCLVLLDLNLPGTNGRQFLEALRRSQTPPAIPIVVLSTSNNPRDVAACYRLGVAGYLCKPLSLDEYVEKMRGLTRYWFDAITLPEESI